MGYVVVLVFASVCLLQLVAGNECTKIQIRIPVCSLNGGNSQKLNTRVPYPVFRNNNMCQFCNGNNPFRFTPLPNSFIASIPSKKSRTGRITLTFDTGSGTHGKEVASPTYEETDEKVVDVIVKLLNKNETTATSPTSTSGKSSAISNKFGDHLTANTAGLIFIPGSDKVVNISVLVKHDKKGKSTGISKLKSNIITDDGQGSVSHTNTEADIKKTDESETVKSNNNEAVSGDESGAAAGSAAGDGVAAAGSAAKDSDGVAVAGSASKGPHSTSAAGSAAKGPDGAAAAGSAAHSDDGSATTAAAAASDDGPASSAAAAGDDGASAATAAAP